MTTESEATLSRNPFGYHSRRWWVGLAAFLFLFLVGPFAEFGNMDLGTIHHAPQLAEHYQTMLLCFSLLLIYLVPFFLFVRYTRMRAGVPRWLVLLAFASGLFVPGWIAGELNAGADDLLRLLASKSFVSTWGDAIEAPLVEETLKLLTVVAVLRLVGRRDGRDWLVGGMCVGMGFQFSEDLGYIEDQIVAGHHGFETAVPFTLDDRISGALVSHWTYTALVAVAIWLLFCQRRRVRGFLLLFVPLLSHAAWDTPLSDAGALFEAFFCLIAAVPFLYAWGDITFDGGRRLSAARPKQRKRRKAQGAHVTHAAPGEKDASPAPQPPQGL
ncbi:PrsW family intramembrane metalloprotease [Parafannyhessea umbonata]|uniref:PrsW family intramembrane metalloprotease n=2 Tax=Parafannyhessea umbonata TaxID=604330 RepID=A0A6N7XBI2_9ACTN|nr:PrsW family intramembrane metalloprotease [Parafannyhessea umbonata]MST60873.1 PrsW family intramembrane metalloprotease [Parafannyhessea umbonata]